MQGDPQYFYFIFPAAKKKKKKLCALFSDEDLRCINYNTAQSTKISVLVVREMASCPRLLDPRSVCF